MPNTSLSQTPLFQHLLTSLPSLRSQIKDAVTASMKQWLLEIRNISAEVGRFAVEAMEARMRRWRQRRERDPLLRPNRVGSAVELITYEKIECKCHFNIHLALLILGSANALDNDKLHVNFKPLFECIHIYTALDSLGELQKSYQADRKVSILSPNGTSSRFLLQAQSDLILPIPLPLASISTLIQEISGFFIVESHVLETTGHFRSSRDIEDLWDGLVSQLSTTIESALEEETNAETFLKVKEDLSNFIMIVEVVDCFLDGG